MIKIKKKYTKYLILFVVMQCLLISCGKEKKENDIKVVDIYDVVQEAFITDKGYTDELAKNMPEDVFNRTNAYKTYAVDSSEYKGPFKVNLILNEDYQEIKDDTTVYVNMKYSVDVIDSQGKEVGGSREIPIRFTVNISDSGWYITDKYEEV